MLETPDAPSAVRRAAESAARGTGRGARPRARRDGHLRRVGRSGAPQAAARALQPDARSAAARPLRDRRVRAPRGQRRGVPRGDARRLQRARAPPPDRSRAVVSVRAQHLLPAGRIRGPRLVHRAQAAARGHRADARPARQPGLLSRDAAVVVRVGDPQPRPGRAGAQAAAAGRAEAGRPAAALRARDHREAVRHRSGDGARAQPRHPRDAGRAADLPDRSLPRQRDGPEPAGVPLRERHLRAGLEQPLRRPRADHRRREHRRRGARRLLRAGGQPARHGAEPPAPGA